MHLSLSSRGGVGSGNPQESDCDVYPQDRDFDRTCMVDNLSRHLDEFPAFVSNGWSKGEWKCVYLLSKPNMNACGHIVFQVLMVINVVQPYCNAQVVNLQMRLTRFDFYITQWVEHSMWGMRVREMIQLISNSFSLLSTMIFLLLLCCGPGTKFFAILAF